MSNTDDNNNAPHPRTYADYKTMQTKPRRMLWQIIAAIALLATGVVVGLFGGRFVNSSDNGAAKASDKAADEAATEPAAKRAVMAVEAVTPSQMKIVDTLDANGLIAATSTAEVSGRLTGVVIEQVLVEEGQAVKKGQLLAVLDTRTLTEQRTQAAADLATAEAAKDKAAADLARTEPLLAIDAVSRQEVDAHRVALRQASANIAAAQSRLATAKNNEANGRVTAPVAGIISAKHAQVGTLTTGASLFSIIESGKLEWQATLSPADAMRIHVGQTAKISLGDDGQALSGTVSRLSPTANERRDVVAHVSMPAHSRIKAGMYQSGQFLFGSQTLPSVPMAALLSSDGYDYLWTLAPTATTRADGLYQVKRQQITIRGQQGRQIAVDIPADTLIVAQSASFLNESDLVRIASLNGVVNNEPSTQTTTHDGQ